ncbi:MAG: chromosomal replication initiator protein DnaA [Lentisphaeria bacterium]|nr:chromosomal replication initiator protein DnaA [Lentisphaeria bacterium]
MGQETLTAGEVWDLAAGRLKQRSETLYQQWFGRMPAVALADGVLTLGVNDEFSIDLLREEYDDLITAALSGIHGRDYRYQLVPGYPPQELPEEPVAPAKKTSVPPRAAAEVRSPRLKASAHTFDNFVTGYNNRHACAAARAVAQAPGDIYNPLFLYGSNGVGKTHLLQAIAHDIGERRPQLVVRYVTCDEMLNEFYELLRQRRSFSDFRTSLCDVDVLLIDDVHRLAKKVVLQEEFFNIFNILCRRNKQIVLTSDRQPCELSDIDKRLSSRFEQGMTCQIGMPEYEERVVILRMWRDTMLTRPQLSDTILEYLAEHISSTVRRLKGCFLRLSAYASMSGCEDLSIAEAENLLHAQLAQESASRDLSPETIQRAVANHFGVTLTDIIGKCRSRSMAAPRMVAMYLCRKLTRLSSTEIGEVFGRTHANVLHAAKTVAERCTEDDLLRRAVTQLERQLQKR